MPAARINRSKIEDVVAKYASLAAAAGLDWPTVERLSERRWNATSWAAEP
jgi:hypothetical protein